MQYTENLNLTKYEANDPTNWLVTFNTNMDKIDSGVGNVGSRLTEIESDVSTAISTANSASTTASNALSVANSKTSIDDLVSSASTTYSSNKINELISGIQPGTEIDDSVTSTTKTWSSSKINTEITAVETLANTKASINDTTASNTTTYSSNKIDDLLDDINPIPYTGIKSNGIGVDLTHNTDGYTGVTGSLTAGYYYLQSTYSTSGVCYMELVMYKAGSAYYNVDVVESPRKFISTPILYIPENCYIELLIRSTTDSFTTIPRATLYKVS